MNRSLILKTFILVLLSEPSLAQMSLGENTTIVFATVDQAKEILTRQDDFVRSMSPFDRSAIMKTDRDVSETEYLNFVGESVLPWNEDEKQKVTAAFEVIRRELETFSSLFPKQVFIVKTTGKEEGGAAYTRSNAIIFPQAMLNARIQKTLAHELFHIVSRANPDLRQQLYAAIGFMECEEIEFPAVLKSRKITNPDAPYNDHCINIQVGGRDYWAMPILFSATEKYDVQRGGEFFDYLQFQFLLAERDANSLAVKLIYESRNPKLVDMSEISGFFEQVGRNTGYIIHPEEILADNFALMILRASNMPSPEIISKLEKILKAGLNSVQKEIR